MPDLLSALTIYGPLGLMAAVFAFLFWKEREQTATLWGKLYELGIESLRADMEHTKALEGVEKAMDRSLTVLQIALESKKGGASDEADRPKG